VEATWTLNDDQQIDNGGRYAVNVDDKTCTLRISGCTRADAGEYRLVVHNAVGTDSAAVKLTVLDKPEAPVSQIGKNGINHNKLILKYSSVSPLWRMYSTKQPSFHVWNWIDINNNNLFNLGKPPALDGGALVTK
jgi:hypothetical protein